MPSYVKEEKQLDLTSIFKRSYRVITQMILDKFLVWDKYLTLNHKECSSFLLIQLNFGSGSIILTFLIMQKLSEDKFKELIIAF